MPTTFIPLATTTVGAGGASSIDFTSISASYTDLLIKISSRTNENAIYGSVYVTLNGATTPFNTGGLQLEGTGSATASSAQTNNEIGPGAGNNATANIFGCIDVYIPNYAGSNNKRYSTDCTGENNATATITKMLSGLWSNTAAITSITLKPNGSSTFNQYTTATLYGIKNS